MPTLQLPCCLERETSRSRRLLCLPDFSYPGKPSPIPGDRVVGAGCPTSLVRQLQKQHPGLAPVPSSSAWDTLPERHLLSSFLSHSDFPLPLIRVRKDETILFGARAASGAWWLHPGAPGGMPVWWIVTSCSPAPLCPDDLPSP